jgi:molybdopterin molybdotransferase
LSEAVDHEADREVLLKYGCIVMQNQPTLSQARKSIRQHVIERAAEKVPLRETLGRIAAASHYAPYPYPEFSQSCYDGYVIAKTAVAKQGEPLAFHLVGEIAAGDTGDKTCTRGSAHRIMTGAPTPKGAWKVVPQEECREDNGRVVIPGSAIVQSPSRIKRKGSDLRQGSLLVRKGEGLMPAHLARLADAGIESVEVYSRPKVSFFCTGSELIDSAGKHLRGKKISSNRYLLSGLVRSLGACADDCDTVDDNKGAMRDHLRKVMENGADIIISTGGMGPGKYDLVEETFTSVGGVMYFNTLKLRPGKATLFGMLGHSLYFGLPGPPSAVQALFQVLVKPALLALQGVTRWKSQTMRARLWEDLRPRKTGMLQLLEAVSWEEKGKRYVRLARNREIANCYLYYPSAGKSRHRGELMKVEPVVAPPYLSI